MQLTWQYKRFNALSAAQMHELLALRQVVFIIEQQCIYEDADQWDSQSWHVMGRDEAGRLVAYARITLPDTKADSSTIGRLLVKENYRGSGLGSQLLQHCVEKCQSDYPKQSIRLSAQTNLVHFYQAKGFETVGIPYDDEGIEHIDMVLTQK